MCTFFFFSLPGAAEGLLDLPGRGAGAYECEGQGILAPCQEHCHEKVFLDGVKQTSTALGQPQAYPSLSQRLFKRLPQLGVRGAGLNSALRDRRFEPITQDEVSMLHCTVSLLHGFEQARSWRDWDLGLHGLIIEFKGVAPQALLRSVLALCSSKLKICLTFYRSLSRRLLAVHRLPLYVLVIG